MSKSGLPKVSVCIPTFNGAKYLCQAVESVLAQSYQDYEIVIVDNCSTDHTDVVVEALLKENQIRIRYYKNDCNIGLVGNFNACLSYAHGKYMKYLCVDDLLMPHCLEEMIQALDEDPSVALVAGGRQIINEVGESLAVHRYSATSATYSGFEVINRCLFGSNYIGEPSAVMFRRKAALRGFRTELAHLMDLEMWFYLLEQGNMVNLPEPLCAIRHHAGQMTVQSIKTGALVEDNVLLIEEYGRKQYINNSWINTAMRRIHMAYRVWLCRTTLDVFRRRQVLRLYSLPLFYHIAMPVLARMLTWLRQIHLIQR